MLKNGYLRSLLRSEMWLRRFSMSGSKDSLAAALQKDMDLHSLSPDDEVLITILEAYAQAENTNRSENTRWGIKRSTENPNAAIYARPCFAIIARNQTILSLLKRKLRSCAGFSACT